MEIRGRGGRRQTVAGSLATLAGKAREACAAVPTLRHRSALGGSDLVGLAVLAAAGAAVVARRRDGTLDRYRREVDAAVAEVGAILATSPTGIVLVDGRTLQRVNQAFATITGREVHELQGSPYLDLVHPDDREAALALTGEVPADGAPVAATLRIVRPDGEERWVQVSVRPLAGSDLRVAAVADTTAEHDARVELEAAKARFAALVERSSDVICVLGADGRITYASPAGERLLAGSDGAQLGARFLDLIHPDDAASVAEAFEALLADPRGVCSVHARARTGDGTWRHLEVVASNHLDDPAVRGVVANVRDVSERAEAAARLSWQAFHDSLTRLPNRALLLDRLAHALDRARREDSRTALLFLDLDGFKLVNDTLGHSAGDRLLVDVGRRLTGTVRQGDTVARLGGDEFVVLCEDVADVTVAERLAGRIVEAFVEPFDLDDNVITVTTSIGIALDSDHSPDTLLRDADAALYRAKDRGKNRWEVFDDAIRADAMRRLTNEQILRRALDRDQFVVHHQPIVDLATGQVASTEALLRIPDAEGRLRSPVDFLQAAEDCGLIVQLGAGVLDLALGHLAGWRREVGALAPRSVSVNITARQLASGRFPEAVIGCLEHHGLTGRDLVLELTETTIIGADRSTNKAINRLHDHGIALAVDDFGTGYSSLGYLKRFPISAVKLDQSFVEGLGREVSDTEIVRAIISLGRALGLLVVAEGIETAEQLRRLRELGCDLGQGFLLSKAVAPEEIPSTIARMQDRLAPAFE